MKALKSSCTGFSLLLLLVASANAGQHKRPIETFMKAFDGTVGKYKVRVILTEAFGNVWGNYYYTKFKTDSDNEPYDHYIDLAGEKSDKSLRLHTSGDDDPYETFTGTFVNDTLIVGTWHSKDRKKSLPFQLTAMHGGPYNWSSQYPRSKPDPNDLMTYYNRDPLESKFFEVPIVQTSLRSILGPDFDSYIDFLADARDLGLVYDQIKIDSGMLTSDIWQAHDGPANWSSLYIDLKTNKCYLSWIKNPPEAHVYGNRPFPPFIRRSFAFIFNDTYRDDFEGIIYDLTGDSLKHVSNKNSR